MNSSAPNSAFDSQQPSPPSAASNADALPSRIGEYAVLDLLGRGGMAVVYRVREPSRGTEIALKQLTIAKESSNGPELVSLFEREYHTLAQLKHPSVIEVYDYGVAEAGPYYTMELLDGGDLSELSPLPFEVACKLLMEVCSSLSLLHARHLVHRDVSPRNVRRTRDGVAKLIDFGAMVPMGSSHRSVGTPAFIAPEVLHQLALDARTDLFSLGGTLYFALTARLPFPVRTFAELRRAWREDPIPPSQIVAGIPAALDALVLTLLGIDPARRPRSAFEVMQRLAAIAGIASPESDAIASAYLSAPTLVGREREQRRFRHSMRRAQQRQGGGLVFEGAEGLGRSRFLDVCALEAKTAGATVLRLSGRAASQVAFSGAHRLLEGLEVSAPSVAHEAARRSGLANRLFEAAVPAPGQASDALALLPIERWRMDRPALQAALTSLLQRVGEAFALVIAVDDLERIDEATLALLAAVSQDAAESQLLLIATLDSRVAAGTNPALDVLCSRCNRVRLSPLTRDETERLFASVFGAVPNLTLVSERTFAIARGNPRESMALAQHMLDAKLIRYSDGHWILPAALALSDLPATAEEALQARIQALPPLARRFAEAHAVSLDSTWKRADYAQLAGPSEANHVDEAITELLRHELLASDGVVYTLAQRGCCIWLCQQLTAAECTERHAAVARVCASSSRHGLYVVHHLLRAAHVTEALERMAQLLREVPSNADFQQEWGMPVMDIAATLASAHEAATRVHAAPRLTIELARHLTALSLVTDNEVHRRYSPSLLAQLELDTGLTEYRAASSEIPAAERLQHAVNAALARYEASPESERVYRFDEALRHIAWYVTLSIAIGSRTRDAGLLASLPSKLEPFIALSPILECLWQNTISAHEMNTTGRSERGLDRAHKLYEALAPFVAAQPYVETIRNAIAMAIGSLETSLGNPSVQHWLEIMDRDPMQHVNAMYLRRLLCIYQGDPVAAERYQKQAEVLAVQASARQMFAAPLRRELAAQVLVGDLTALREVADAIAQLASREPGWVPQHRIAQGYFQRLRGDLPAAKENFERCLAESQALGDHTSWIDAAAGYVSVLVELGEYASARDYGLAALAHSRELEIDFEARDLIRELALAEAKLNDFASATARLDALIADRQGTLESHVVPDHEARTRVAIWAKDPRAPQMVATLTTMLLKLGRGPLLLERQQHLRNEAKLAGVEFQMPQSAFETSVLGASARPQRSAAVLSVMPALRSILKAEQRITRALNLIMDAFQAPAGRLYLVQSDTLRVGASLGVAETPLLDDFVKQFWSDQMGDAMLTEVLPLSTNAVGAIDPAGFLMQDGATLRLIMLRCAALSAMSYVGVVALRLASDVSVKSEAWDVAAAVSGALHELGDAEAISPD